MIGVSEEELRKRLEMLRIEHRDLDAAIEALSSAGPADPQPVGPQKKRQHQQKEPNEQLEE